MLVMFAGMVMLLLKKALFPMLVTLFGIVTLVYLVFAYAFAAMAVVPAGITSAFPVEAGAVAVEAVGAVVVLTEAAGAAGVVLVDVAGVVVDGVVSGAVVSCLPPRRCRFLPCPVRLALPAFGLLMPPFQGLLFWYSLTLRNRLPLPLR